PDHTVPAHLPGQREQVADDHLVAPDDAVGARRGAGPQHPVGRVEDDGGGGQGGEHLGGAGGQLGGGRGWGNGGPAAATPRDRQPGAEPDRQTGEGGDHGQDFALHSSIVSVRNPALPL